MKKRILWIALAFVAGFVLLTSRAGWNLSRWKPMAGAGRLWSGPTSVQGAGLTSDEVNNIDIYRSSRDATVYLTSTVYRRSFWDV